MKICIEGISFGALCVNCKAFVGFRIVVLPRFAEKTFGITSLMFFVVVLVGRTKKRNRVAFASR